MSLYLSRVEIDSNNRQKIRDLSHVGAYHNWVEQSFPEEFEQKIRTRKLWRIDQLHNKEYLLVVSSSQPDLTLLEKYGVAGTAASKNYDPFLNSIYEGMEAQFRITLNPSIAIKKGNHGKRGRVMPHVSYEFQEKFLMDRSLKNGFSVEADQFQIVDRGYVLFKKANQRTVRLVKVTYQGVLRVEDKEKFIQTLTEGFGKKKAYGFGLMTIIPRS